MDLNLLSCYLFSICLICSLGTYNYITEKDFRVNLIQVLHFTKKGCDTVHSHVAKAKSDHITSQTKTQVF